jgi:sulfur carrier protein ThiS
MKIKVKLYGTLSEHFPDYQPSQGIEVEIPDGATAQDLLTLLRISESQRAIVIAEGRVLKADDRMRGGVSVNIMQAISGG